MVQPRNASTVVLLRPADNDAFEILLTRRPPEMKFLGGYYVFPGGAVHRDDYSSKVLERCRGLSATDARRILGYAGNANHAIWR
jgi:8-oxo-dGTP pyrophosphatase MutT (NUDIX family)